MFRIAVISRSDDVLEYVSKSMTATVSMHVLMMGNNFSWLRIIATYQSVTVKSMDELNRHTGESRCPGC